MGRKKKKFKQITISISNEKAELFEIFCKNKKLTPNKYLKTIVKRDLEHFDGRRIIHQPDPRQLNIFDYAD